MSPRLNVERTQEKKEWEAHEKYIKEHYPNNEVNSGWYQDSEVICSKIYDAEDPRVVTTYRESLRTGDEPYG